MGEEVFISPMSFTEFLDWIYSAWEIGEVKLPIQVGERASVYQYQSAQWLFSASEQFAKKVAKCDKRLQLRVEDALKEIHNNPIQKIGDTLTPLKHLKDYWRYRIGKYRLLYLADVEHRKIYFSDFDSRGGVYE